MKIEIGDLAPVRSVLAWVEQRIDNDRGRRPDDDPALLVLQEVQKRLEAAIADAGNAELELTVEQLAEMEGVTRAAIYKRRQRGKLDAPRRGGRIRIPLKAVS
jgi:excisionase family DNA binding protein